MRIDQKPQPTHTQLYYHTLMRVVKNGRLLGKALKRGRRSVRSLRGIYGTEEELYTAARCFDIKQTYLDGEWYWELYKPEHKGFSVRSIDEL